VDCGTSALVVASGRRRRSGTYEASGSRIQVQRADAWRAAGKKAGCFGRHGATHSARIGKGV